MSLIVRFDACPICGSSDLAPSFVYDTPPEGETKFDFGETPYQRFYRVCERCGHFSSNSDMDLSALYDGAYVDATYSDADGIRRTFEKIIGLPSERSDNTGRVACIEAFRSMHSAWDGKEAPSCLDVGSGLAVFPYAMRLAGWRCTALDPDQRAAEHARSVAGVEAITADFLEAEPGSLGRHDLVSFNKVLEHVVDPIDMLRRTHSCLAPDGVVYVELPDGEGAADDGPGREEFFIEHHHVFSLASLALLAVAAGFRVLSLERIREPSTKFTLRAFLEAAPDQQ